MPDVSCPSHTFKKKGRLTASPFRSVPFHSAPLIEHNQVVEDISPSRLTPREVQKIALLDMRLLNRDRNSVNILVRSRPRRSCSFSDRSRSEGGSRHNRHNSSDNNIGLTLAAAGGAEPTSSSGSRKGSTGGSSGGHGDRGATENGGGSSRRPGKFLGGATEYELIPIDHGLCLSDELVIDWCDWCWLDWRQVKEVGAMYACRTHLTVPRVSNGDFQENKGIRVHTVSKTIGFTRVILCIIVALLPMLYVVLLFAA